MFCKCNWDSKSYSAEAFGVGWTKEAIHPQLTLTSKPNLLLSPDIKLGGGGLCCLVTRFCSFPLSVLSSDGCYGSDHRCPSGKRPLDPSCFLLDSLSPLFLLYHGTQLAVTLITMLNTLVEILSALHLALFLCSVWSQACTILCWIFSSEENSIKGALIIHGARFRFVPHCSERENSPLCYFAEELWIGFLGLMYSSATLNQAWYIVDLNCKSNWGGTKDE